MTIKKLSIFIAILVIIVAIIAISENLSNGKAAAKTTAFFPEFSEATCSALLISDKSGSVKLTQKSAGSWIVSAQTANAANPLAIPSPVTEASPEYKADSASITVALEKIQKMSRDVLVSTNAAKKGLFEVDSANGIRVEVINKEKGSLGTFYIGKSSSDAGSDYVRMVGSDEVYSVMGSIRYSFFTDTKRWRSKAMFAVNPKNIQKLTIMQKDSATIVLEKSKDTTGQPIWTLSAPKQAKASNSAVEAICTAFAGLQTADWESDGALADTAMGFTKPTLVVTAQMENSETKTLVIGREKATSSQAWGKTDEQATIYLVAKYNLSSFQKSVNDLLEIQSATPPKS
jgi:hypothetical protein